MLELLDGPTPSRSENGEFSNITLDSLRVARFSGIEIPAVQGTGSAASVIMEYVESVDIGTSRSESTTIIDPSDHWIHHHSSGIFIWPIDGPTNTW